MALVLVLLILKVMIGRMSSHVRGLRSHMHLRMLVMILFMRSVRPLDLGRNGLLCEILMSARRAVSFHTSATKFGPRSLMSSVGHPWMARTRVMKPLANSVAEVVFVGQVIISLLV